MIDQQTVYFKERITGKAGHFKWTCSSNNLLSLEMQEDEPILDWSQIRTVMGTLALKSQLFVASYHQGISDFV